MSAQYCPKCKEEAFVWSIDETVSRFTLWNCSLCGYDAKEDESKESICSNCKNPTLIYLFDKEETYTWCSSCNAIKTIHLTQLVENSSD